MQILVLLVPALIATVLFEKFKGEELSIKNRVIAMLIFAFFINMICYGVLWLRGWTYQSWAADNHSTLTSIPSTIKYMGVALVSSVTLSYIASFLSFQKGKIVKLVLDKKGEMIISTIILAATVIFGIIYFS